PFLEGAEVIDPVIAHVFERLAGQCRASARGTIDDERLVLGKIFVVVGRFGIGSKFQHATRDVHTTSNLAALFYLRSVAHVDNSVCLSRSSPVRARAKCAAPRRRPFLSSV